MQQRGWFMDRGCMAHSAALKHTSHHCKLIISYRGGRKGMKAQGLNLENIIVEIEKQWDR